MATLRAAETLLQKLTGDSNKRLTEDLKELSIAGIIAQLLKFNTNLFDTAKTFPVPVKLSDVVADFSDKVVAALKEENLNKP